MEKIKERETLDFNEMLLSLHFGDIQSEIESEQKNLLKEIRKTGKSGKLTITLTYTPDGQHQIQVGAAVKSTLPIRVYPKTTLFLKNDGLFKDDPLQITMDDISGNVSPINKNHKKG